MNVRKVALLLIAFLSLLALTLKVSTASEPDDQIIVNNADEIVQPPVAADQDLLSNLEVVDPRVVAQYANFVRHEDLPAVPGALQTLLDEVAERVVVEYANTVLREELVGVPGDLGTLLNQVSERIVFQYANTNRKFELAYPLEMIGDTTDPQIDQVVANPAGGTEVLIVWTTDEFATSTVLYGTQPGSYPNSVSDPLYVKDHEIALTGLTPGTTYFYKVRSTDLSGNTSTSVEHSFTAVISVHLPIIIRNTP